MMIEPLESRIAPATVYAVDSANNLLIFNSATPNAIGTSVAIDGLNTGDTVEGIDFRPETGALYALVVNGTSARIGTLNAGTGAFMQTVPAFTVSGSDFGFDFNPTNDRMRVVSDTDINLSIDPDTGIVTTQTALNPGSPDVAGVAYSNNFVGAGTTTLYAVDANNDMLRIQETPASGTLSNVGPLGVDISGIAGFDITTGNAAFAALQTGGLSQLFTINLATGAASFIGPIGNGATPINGIAVLGPEVTLINARTATFTDVDGDLVTIEVSKGTLEKADFILGAEGLGAQLRLVDFSNDGAEFSGTDLSITAARSGLGGDGFVNVGYINGTGVDLGTVRVKGDLGAIDAGDANGNAAGLGSLKVQSLGRLGLTTGAPDLVSNVQGDLDILRVRGSVVEAQIAVAATAGIVTGSIGSILVGQDLIGGAANDTGSISAALRIGDVSISGSMLGGGGNRSGRIDGLTLGDVTIGGSIEGAGGNNSGELFATEDMGEVRIGGNVLGGSGTSSGSIDADGAVSKVLIDGSLTGGGGDNSGSVLSGGTIGKVRVGGDQQGAGGAQSGTIESGVNLTKVVVQGSVASGSGARSGSIMADRNLGEVIINGSVTGTEADPVQISGAGQSGSTTRAIESVTIAGDATYLNVLGGYDDAAAVNGDARIGAIEVAGDWIASDAVAGVAAGGDGIFGTGDDTIIGGGSGAVFSKIASIVIGGQALGTPVASNSSDGFGFVAQQIGSFQVGVTSFPLTLGAGNDTAAQFVGGTSDVRLREFAV